MNISRALAAALFGLLWACENTSAPEPENLAIELGSDTYVGAAVIDEELQDGNVSTWTFTEEGRTGCMRGAPFQMATRDMGAQDLVMLTTCVTSGTETSSPRYATSSASSSA